MFESWTDDNASGIEPQNYWDSPQRFQNDADSEANVEAELDKLIKEQNNE